jgi:hypothetical protein
MFTIDESHMTFGPFSEEECFHIEKSTIYTRNKDSVKMVEFVLLQDARDIQEKLLFVEAKSSFSQPVNQSDFDKNVDDVCAKMVNAFHLFLALYLKRHQEYEVELNQRFQNLNMANVDLRFILVIHGFKEEWLPPVKDAFTKQFIPFKKKWKLTGSPFLVLNDNMAQEYNLIR